MAVVPSSIYCGTSLGPDEPGTFAMALSVAVWVAAMDATGRRATTLLVLSGACAGLGQTVREVCFFLFAFYAVEAILRRRWDAVVLPALGFAAVTGLEVATFWIFTGDPLYRIRAIRAAQREQMGNFITGADAAWYAPFWLIYSKRPSYGFHYIGFFIAAAALLYRRDRAAWPTLRWWAILFLLIGFWPARLQPYLRSIPSDFRFYEPLVAPAAVALGYALWKLRTWTFGVAVAAIGLFALASNVVLRRNVDTNGFSVKASYRRVREVRPALPVVADSETLAGFRFLSGYRDTIVAATEPKAEWDEFLLVLNEALLRGLKDLGQGDQGERLARLLETTPHEEISRDDTPRGSNYFTLFSGPKAVKTDGSVRVYRCRRG
jgi:hypothetical protein